MNLRKSFLLSMAAVLCLCRPAFSEPVVQGIPINNGSTAQLIGGKSPSIKVFDAEGNESASIPIEQDPDIFLDLNSPLFKNRYIGNFAYSISNNTLYVVHREKKGEHFISAVNLTTNRVDKLIKVSAGQIVDLYLSTDGSRLFYYSACKPGFSCFGEEKYIPPYGPTISTIDTSSNEVISTYDLFVPRDELSKRNAYLVNKFLAYSDERGLIVQSEVRRLWNGKDESISDRIAGYSGKSSKPRFSIDAGGPLKAIMFSKDNKLLFATIEGNKKTAGSFVVFDLEKGISVTHALTGHPTVLLRFGTKQEPWVLGDEEMRAFSEIGELAAQAIPLNKPRKSEEVGDSGASAFMDGFPGETLSLGDDHAAILIINKNGGSRHKVALVDLKKLQVDAIIPTMSAGEIAGIRTGRYFTALGLTFATGGMVMFTPNWVLKNESLAARPDGRFLFALDLEGHVITVVDVQSATVVKRIPVNSSVFKLQVSTDGKHLICAGKKPQQVNLETNELEN